MDFRIILLKWNLPFSKFVPSSPDLYSIFIPIDLHDRLIVREGFKINPYSDYCKDSFVTFEILICCFKARWVGRIAFLSLYFRVVSLPKCLALKKTRQPAPDPMPSHPGRGNLRGFSARNGPASAAKLLSLSELIPHNKKLHLLYVKSSSKSRKRDLPWRTLTLKIPYL